MNKSSFPLWRKHDIVVSFNGKNDMKVAKDWCSNNNFD